MSGNPFETRIVRDDVIVIKTGQVLDNNNAHDMVDAINSALDKGFKFIVLDMSYLEFLSSAGVGSVLGTVETAREAGGDIILCQATESILHVLEVLDLAEYLTVKPSEKEAALVYESHA